MRSIAISLYDIAVARRMSVPPNLVLVIMLGGMMLYSVIGALFEQGPEVTPVDAQSTYPFPHMQGMISEPQGNATLNTTPLSNESAASSAAVSANGTGNSNINWTVVTGNWRPSGDGVQAGGEYRKAPPGIIVRPLGFASPNLDISTSYTINNISEPPRASYVAIVYSWTDIKNFKFAGITLVNNQTYVFFTTTRDGTRYMSDGTSWPGTRVNLDIEPGDLVSMTLSLRENSEILNVNGTNVENSSVDPNTGRYAGLLFHRIEEILFHDFDVRPSSE